MRRLLAALFFIACASCAASSHRAPPKPEMSDQYLDVITTYTIYSKTIWHEGPAGAGGYWGDGIAALEKNGNGAVRGMCSTMLGYAMLVHAMDHGWLSPEQAHRLFYGGFDRDELLRYIRANLQHIIAHHKSTTSALDPQWGFSWQSPLWLGAAGCAALLVWNDLPDDLRDGIKRVAASEADRVAAKPPKDYKPGDTGAEENGWDSHAPAVALALDPNNPHAARWWQALKVYAVNVYSTTADQHSDARIGTDRLRDLVTTANLFDDFTLENHGFFHPDYVQASGEELAASWTILALGDQLHHTSLARDFEPYAMHHVADVWQKVARPITLSDGQFAFPCGQDWTLNAGMTPCYFAFIATVLRDPVAIEAERRNIEYTICRRAVSPPGRIFGDANMEWFWEPLIVNRCTMALLAHEMLLNVPSTFDFSYPTTNFGAHLFPKVKVWVFRNAEYCATASWGTRHMGVFISDPRRDPCMTFPITDGILPADVSELIDDRAIGDARVLRLKLKNNKSCAVICLPQSVVWISPVPLRGIGIENDRMSGSARDISFEHGHDDVRALEPRAPFTIESSWLNISDRLGFVSSGDGFRYTPAGKYNTRSVAVDRIEPIKASVWQMLPHATAEQTSAAASAFSVTTDANTLHLTVMDRDGMRYRIVQDLADGSIHVEQ